MQVVAGLPVQVMDTLDDRQGLGGERQDMSAAIIGISYALDEAACLQSVKQANERNWPDVENLSEGGLIGPFVLRQLYEDSASSESHAWEVGAQRAIVATASQPGCLEQQPHNHIWIIRARIIFGLRRRLRGRGLLQQTADGRFVRPVRRGRLHFLGRGTQFCGGGHGTSFSIPNPYISNCGPGENENAMHIAFGNELNSSIDYDEVLDPRRRAERAMVPRGQAPAARVKNECGGEGARHSSRPRKHGVEDRHN
jgi:hypothetical protein